MKVGPRLEKLEARMPKGCAACRSWCGTILVGDAGDPSRPERCPGCGRLVPFRVSLHIIGIDLDRV